MIRMVEMPSLPTEGLCLLGVTEREELRLGQVL